LAEKKGVLNARDEEEDLANKEDAKTFIANILFRRSK